MGDPAGIGPDITFSAWLKRDRSGIAPFCVLGDAACLERRAAALGFDIPLIATTLERSTQDFATHLPVVPLEATAPGIAGQPDGKNARAVIEAIETAVDLALSGQARAVVTNPISKSVLYDEGFAFPGHTEFLADRAHRATGDVIRPVMMLAGPKLRAVPVTIHIALRDVAGSLSESDIVETGLIVARDLAGRFGIENPRLVVSGLNPHAGENGAMGREDIEIIAPAVAALRGAGIDARGPLPADTMFHDAARATYDAAICMYHDQALIPAKALGFDDTVNVTLGLPFVRTSPDHGTAFDIAGKGVARDDSLIAALRMADTMTAPR